MASGIDFGIGGGIAYNLNFAGAADPRLMLSEASFPRVSLRNRRSEAESMYTPETLYPCTLDEMTLLSVPVKSLLNRLPDTWGEFDFESLSAIEQRSLQLLTAGGMVEQQISVRVWVPDGRFGCNAICAGTGWNGWDFAVEELYQHLTKDLVPIVYEDWKRWKESPETTLFPVRNKITPPAKWRLTDQGEIAKQDLFSGDRNRVMYFWERIYHRGRFASECLYPGNGRFIQSINDTAEPVASHPATITADIVEEIKASLLQGLRMEIAAGFASLPVIEPLKADADTIPPEASVAIVLADGNQAVIASIASNADLSLDEKMRRVAIVETKTITWPSSRWGNLLGVTDGRVRQTVTWKTWRAADKKD